MQRRKVGQIAAALASALLIVGVFVGQAAANHCNGCIDKADIARNAVGSAELVNGGVKKDDIDTGAVGTGEIVNGSVRPGDLSAGAAVALGSVALSGSTSGTGPDTIDTFTVTAPAAGKLYLHVSGAFYFDLDAANSESLSDHGDLALCTATNTLSTSACGSSSGVVEGFGVWYQDAEDASATDTNHTPFFSLTRVVSVPAGNTTFYLNGQATDGAAAPLSLWQNVRAVALFAPRSLTVTS